MLFLMELARGIEPRTYGLQNIPNEKNRAKKHEKSVTSGVVGGQFLTLFDIAVDTISTLNSFGRGFCSDKIYCEGGNSFCKSTFI